MTTGMTSFTPQQWSVVAGAPLLAAMWVIAASRGSARATLAAVRAYRDARGSYDTELRRELLATPLADAINRPARSRRPPARSAGRAATGDRDHRPRRHHSRTRRIPAPRTDARRG